jgi:hypothetical protein
MSTPPENANFDDFDEFILDGDLTVLADHFESVGLNELAKKLHAIANATTSIDLEQSVTLEVAARMLGLRSPSFLKTLASGGSLEGAQVGEQYYVTRASVARFMDSPTLGTQRRLEKQLWSILGDR